MINLQIAEALLPADDPAAGSLSLVESDLLERAARETLVLVGAPVESDLSLVLTDDAQLHELNREFLGIDAPTDVLSFPGGETDPDSEQLYLGDVVISYPRAQAQAAAGGHPLEDELQLLVVHGVLHLLGHDHADENAKAGMWARQAEVLRRLGCSIRGPANDDETVAR